MLCSNIFHLHLVSLSIQSLTLSVIVWKLNHLLSNIPGTLLEIVGLDEIILRQVDHQ